MSTYEISTLILQALVAIAAFFTLHVYIRQLRTMSGQLEAAQLSNRAQSALAIVTFLQSADVRAARTCVRDVLEKKALSDWTDDEKRSASLVCANYDVVAGLLKSSLAPPELIVMNWTTSIVHCHEILAPFIREMRQRSNDQRYWKNFDWLYVQAKNHSEA